ncbi:MAG: ferredoxin [Deltaproteobacteria bacterium]|nr:ferredoxin [Deltaproteobacteria bacterium]
MGRKVVVDQERCVGCGNCQSLCPEVFRLDLELAKSQVIKPEGGPDCVQEAMDSCPGGAISWQEG